MNSDYKIEKWRRKMNDVSSKPTPGPYHWHPRVEADDRNGSVHLEKTPGHAYAVAMQPRYVENEAWAETAAFITDAFNTLHETGLTPRELQKRCDELLAALKGLVACCEAHPAFCKPANTITISRMVASRAAIAKVEQSK